MEYDKNVIGIVLAMIIPGAGHIFLGIISKGIKISLSFVLLSYLLSSVSPFLGNFIENFISSIFGYERWLYFFIDSISILISSIFLIPLIIIWYKQLIDIVRITEAKTTSVT